MRSTCATLQDDHAVEVRGDKRTGEDHPGPCPRMAFVEPDSMLAELGSIVGVERTLPKARHRGVIRVISNSTHSLG